MNFDPPTNDEIDESKDRQISGLEQILGSMDVDTEDLIRLVTAIGALKKNKKGTNEQTKEQEENKVFLDKTFVLGRDDVYIYRDNRTKKKGWYIRIYEARYRKHWGKSLKTTNKILAMAEAERIYAERKGRMSIGVRPVSITAKELVYNAKWFELVLLLLETIRNLILLLRAVVKRGALEEELKVFII